VEALNWVAVPGLEGPVEAQAKIRYRAPEAPVLIEPLTADRARVRFREPQRAITPGQAIVFYQEDRVLGGGVIARPLPASHETPPVPATSEV